MVKNTFFLSISKILTLLVNLVCNKILVNIFDVYTTGTYQQLITVISMDTLIMFGLPEAILYFFSGNKDEKQGSTIKSIYLLIFIITILGFGVVLGGAGGISTYFKNPEIKNYRVQLALMFGASIVNVCFPSICISYNKSAPMLVITSANSTFKLLVFLYALYSRCSFYLLINFLSAVNVVFLLFEIIILFIFEKNNNSKLSVAKGVSEVLSYSLPLYLTIIIGKLAIYTDKLMIGWFFDTETYAVYSISARELPYTLITTSLITATTPTIIALIKNQKINSAVNIWKKSIHYTSIFIMFAVASNLLMSNELICFLYSEEYLDSKLVFNIYLFALFPRIAYWGIFAKGMNEPKYIFLTSIVELICNFFLNLALIPLLGTPGAAIATVISSYISVCIWIKKNSFLTGLPINELIPWKSITKPFILNCFLFVFFYFIKLSLLSKFESNFLKLSVVASLWGAIILIIFRKDVIEIIKKRNV